MDLHSLFRGLSQMPFDPPALPIYSLERVRQLIAYRDRVLHVLYTEQLTELISYRELHKRAIAATTNREKLQGRYRLPECFSLMNDLVMQGHLLLGHPRNVEIHPTLLFITLLENKPPNRFLNPDELLTHAKSRFPVQLHSLTLADVMSFIEHYSHILLRDGNRIAAQCAVMADRVRQIVTLQPGVLVSCLPHLYEETFEEPLVFKHVSCGRGELTQDQLSGWSEEQIGGLAGIERRDQIQHPWLGVMVQFDLVLFGMTKLCVFPNVLTLEEYQKIVARYVLYRSVLLTPLLRKDQLFIVVNDYIRRRGYMHPTIYRKGVGLPDMYEISHPVHEIGSDEAGRIFDEIDRSLTHGLLEEGFFNITLRLISRSPIGYCSESVSHAIMREESHSGFLDQLIRGVHSLVLVKGPREDRLFERKDLTDRVMPKITEQARKILAEHSNSMKKVHFVKEYVRRHRHSLVHYDIWRHLNGDVKLVKKGINKEEYIECEIVEAAATPVAEPLKLRKSLSSVVKSVPLRPQMTPARVSDEAKSGFQQLNTTTVEDYEDGVDSSVSQSSPVFRDPTPAEIEKCSDILIKKYRYNDSPLNEFLKDSEWQFDMRPDFIMEQYAAFVDRIDAVIVTLSFTQTETTLNEVMKSGYQANLPTELLKIFELMYVRMGRVCLRRSQSCQGLKTFVDLPASRLLELAERKPYIIKNCKEIPVADTRHTVHFRETPLNIRTCIDAMKNHPDRFELNCFQGYFKVKCPHLDLIVDYIQRYAPLGVPPECIAHSCFEHFGTTPADQLNHYPWYKGTTIRVSSFNEDALKCLINLCINDSHFGRHVDQRWRRVIDHPKKVSPFTMNKILEPIYVFSARQQDTAKFENLGYVVEILFQQKALGARDVPLCEIQNFVPIFVSIADLEEATGAVYCDYKASFDIRDLSVEQFLDYLLSRYEFGVCLKRFGGLPQTLPLIEAPVRRENIAKFVAICGKSIDIRLGNCFKVCSEKIAAKRVDAAVQEVISKAKLGGVKVEDLCQVVPGQGRKLLPGWIDRLISSLDKSLLEVVINANDELYIRNKQDVSCRTKTVSDKSKTNGVQPKSTKKKPVTIEPHVDKVLEANVRLLLADYPKGISTSEISKMYFQRFEAQPSFGGNMKNYFKKMSDIVMTKETLDGVVSTVVRFAREESSDTQKVVPLSVDLEAQSANIHSMLSVYQDGVDVSRLRDLYKSMFGARIVLPSDTGFKEYLGTIDFLEIVQLQYQNLVRLKLYVTVGGMDKHRFDYILAELLRQVITEDKKEIGYEFICRHYLAVHRSVMPCSRQFGKNNIYEVLHSSKDIGVRYNNQGTSVLLRLKDKEEISYVNVVNQHAELRQALADLLRSRGTGMAFSEMEAEYKKRSQGSGLAFAEFLSKSPKLVVYRECNQDMIRLRSMKVRPSDDALAPLVIMLALSSPLNMKWLIKRTNFDTSQYGFGQMTDFFGALRDVFICDRERVMLKKGSLPMFLRNKMQIVFGSMKTGLKTENFGNYFKQQSGIQVNPRCLGFRSWEELLLTSFPDELCFDFYGYFSVKKTPKPVCKKSKAVEATPMRSSPRASERKTSTSAHSTSSLSLSSSVAASSENLFAIGCSQSLLPSTIPQQSQTQLATGVSLDSLDETMFDKVLEMLVDMGSILFPEEFIEEYNSRFQPAMPDFDHGTLLLVLASRVPMTIQTDGGGGISLLLASNLDMPLIDEDQEEYNPLAHAESSRNDDGSDRDDGGSVTSRSTTDQMGSVIGAVQRCLISEQSKVSTEYENGFDNTDHMSDRKDLKMISTSRFSSVSEVNRSVKAVLERLKAAANDDRPVELTLPDFQSKLDEIGAVRKCIENELE